MASDYAAIRAANRLEYGNVGRWGQGVLVDRYDSGAHFIYEFLQNAEDALRRRGAWQGSRAILFDLTDRALQVTHSGSPFTTDDVKGVCGVGETTKDLTDIGRFGIGFKSVYSITDRPEVHSGDEDFAIENFVFPVPVPPIKRAEDETVFRLPLRQGDENPFTSIADGLGELGPRALLFLRQIDEIGWSVAGEPVGHYFKERADDLGSGSRRISIIGEREGRLITDESWLIFGREVYHANGPSAGFVEIAFLHDQKGDGPASIHPLDSSPLIAFFPTVLQTNLGFLVQGPYRTTPSRDNVPPKDPWNASLVAQTAELLVEALAALKAEGMLDVSALQSMPLDRGKYADGTMFAPLFQAVHAALLSQELLPRSGGGWTSAAQARLGRTQDLRDLLSPSQLGKLLGYEGDTYWLTGDITRDAAAQLRNYLIYELEVSELTPELILSRLSREFLEAQPDEWIVRLYEFLAGQPALLRQGKAAALTLVRLEDGSHVAAELNGQPGAFLPSATKTDFPTVKQSVCVSGKSLEFLRALGLTSPDPVDDVVRNVLPKYTEKNFECRDSYVDDIGRMLNAFNTQHRGQREKLVAALGESYFVMSVDLGDNHKSISKPGDVYLNTERLQALLTGVPGVMFVDDSYECLKGSSVRELLEACGASRSLVQEAVECELSYAERAALRRAAGCGSSSTEYLPDDHTLRGLPGLLELLPSLSVQERRTRAELLWKALGDVEERRGSGAFAATYSWFYYYRRQTSFDPAFVRALNSTPWVPDVDGELQSPAYVTLESLGWEPRPFLASKILFKKPVIDQLATEAGIDPKVLDILKKRGLTNVEDLIAAIGGEQETELGSGQEEHEDSERPFAGDAPQASVAPIEQDSEAVSESESNVVDAAAGGPAVTDSGDRQTNGPPGEDMSHRETPPRNEPAPTYVGRDQPGAAHSNHLTNATSGRAAETTRPPSRDGRQFVTYVGVHPNADTVNPESPDHAALMELEEKAIELIRAREPHWQRTEANNAGFDLFEAHSDGRAMRWCEVKAMAGSLGDRPVGMSQSQFAFALDRRSAYWLYVVEHAGTSEARLVRIQDPAGKAQTFTFDHGWLRLAEDDSDSSEAEH
jgi:hypothetical protein